MKKKNLYYFVFLTWYLIVVDAAVKLVIDRAEINTLQPSKLYIPTGSPSLKYKHRRTSTLLHSIRTIRICVEKKTIVSVTYENQRISIKNSLPYIKCVLRLSCVVHGPIYGRFMGCTVNGFLSLLEIYIAIAARVRSYQ